MANDTCVSLRNNVIYSVYVRNHSKGGTFHDVMNDLPRIKELGVDTIWFMPIHPIGVVNKKGSLGCPYAIKDYKDVNPDYGDLDSFKKLVDSIHSHNMKCIIDVVYNHTSPDSVLYNKSPQFFYRKPNGDVGNKVADWYDIIDLDYSNKDLWVELIEALKFWVTLGVDGFRCDVAPLIPLEFWMEAKAEVEKINKDVIWLSETVDPGFINYIRQQNFYAASDSEIYQAFDITYDYDGFSYFKNYLEGQIPLNSYLEKLRQQEYIYPANYVKLRFLENHDQARIKKLIPQEDKLRMWTAFMYFQRGSVLLYAGQEAQETHTPSLFDVDLVTWNNLNSDFTSYLKTLYSIKQKDYFSKGYYTINKLDKDGVIYATYEYNNKAIVGVFNVEGKIGEVNLNIKDGNYTNLIDKTSVEVKDGKVQLSDTAVIFEV